MSAPPDTAASPTVSVIVRSTDRPTLSSALASIATQDYAAVEIVVVGASGPEHPEPPASFGPHPCRFVRCATRRNRPQAANDGLDRATGDWITFLDDDDVFLPGHLSGLMAERARAPEARIIYSFARAVFADGRVERFGQPFSLTQLYARNLLSLSTAVFDRALLDTGCRFDEQLQIHEDWDFCLQIAQSGTFHFVPFETFQWNADTGRSGAGGGANQDDATFARYRDIVYAKWGSRRDALIERIEPLLRSAAEMARQRDYGSAEEGCRKVLAVSPNDPWALNLLASIERATGRQRDATKTQQLAVAVCPHHPALTFNLALLYQAQGELDMARRCCERAAALDSNFAPAKKLLAQLSARA